ncbi:polysaccharide deacetylase family protein [Aliiglaciecola sp. LCG003]|uniref:polysaccharide deacetylase family protein n=1 Tax=Aliiglaciecola sp. LCG003 TaxID=3053655 RepID=UPI0025742552|nr:polysaccharide deacetylase family protein [Aliiglaciecola sp. LCG003]WJG10457.1 polysaccharide deacetylase family protein [Aliiglaciecola sp. LCG003]
MHSLLSVANSLLSGNKLSILIYHQVLEAFDPMRPYEVTAEVFDWHMALISRYFTPISLTDAAKYLEQGKLPDKAICVTFDDGYLNNLTVAQPILAKYKIPATVYVATAFTEGADMWNDRVLDLFNDAQLSSLIIEGESVTLGDWEKRNQLAAAQLMRLKYLPIDERLAGVQKLYDDNNLAEPTPRMMNAQQVKQLADCGVEIGGHTVNHPILKVLSPEQQFDEVSRCKAQLEQWTGKPVKHFAYPNGSYGKDLTDETVELVKKAGYETAVVTDWGTSSPGDDLLRLKRFTPWDSSAWKFHARLVKSRLTI